MDGAGSIYLALNANGSSTVTKFSPIDRKIIYSTSIPSSVTSSITVDRVGNAYVTGTAELGLPATPGAYKSALLCSSAVSTCTEAFVVKVGATGTIQYATYANASGRANAIAVDSEGQVWITGNSSVSPAHTTDAFIIKLDSAGGKRLLLKTFAGAGGHNFVASDAGSGIAIDSKDAAYAVGFTQWQIPTTPGTIQPGRPSPLYTATPFGYIVKIDSAETQCMQPT